MNAPPTITAQEKVKSSFSAFTEKVGAQWTKEYVYAPKIAAYTKNMT